MIGTPMATAIKSGTTEMADATEKVNEMREFKLPRCTIFGPQFVQKSINSQVKYWLLRSTWSKRNKKW